MSFGIGDILGSVSKAIDLANPIEIGKNALKEILPDQLDWIADVGALGANLYEGNYIAALHDFEDFSKDFKKSDLAGDLGSKAEPEPPPSGGWHPAPSKTTEPSVTQAVNTIETQGGWRTAPTNGTTAPAAPAAPTATAPATAPASSSPAQTTSSSSAAPGGSSTAVQKFMATHSDPKSFMDAVTNGQLPEDVTKDPQAMMAIQARMNQISQMFSLMTNMMSALHEMQMSIVRNIRA